MSSRSDSLVSLLPRTLPLTELVALIAPDMGVCGGVVQGNPVNEELDAATLGTFPTVGVGLLVTTPVGVWICDGWERTDEEELVLPGLGRLANGEGENEDPSGGMICFSKSGAEDVVGVGVGVGWDEDMVDCGWWAVGM